MPSPTTTTTKTQIGKIKSIRLGTGGYQDAMFGISVELGSDTEHWGVGDFHGVWATGERKNWTEENRNRQYSQVFEWLIKLMAKAKVSDMYELVGTPVEVMFENNRLKEWRILEEVL